MKYNLAGLCIQKKLNGRLQELANTKNKEIMKKKITLQEQENFKPTDEDLFCIMDSLKFWAMMYIKKPKSKIEEEMNKIVEAKHTAILKMLESVPDMMKFKAQLLNLL